MDSEITQNYAIIKIAQKKLRIMHGNVVGATLVYRYTLISETLLDQKPPVHWEMGFSVMAQTTDHRQTSKFTD